MLGAVARCTASLHLVDGGAAESMYGDHEAAQELCQVGAGPAVGDQEPGRMGKDERAGAGAFEGSGEQLAHRCLAGTAAGL